MTTGKKTLFGNKRHFANEEKRPDLLSCMVVPLSFFYNYIFAYNLAVQ